MNTESLKKEILSAENNLLGSLRDGNIKQGVAIHLANSEYHNIWNGEDKDYTA